MDRRNQDRSRLWPGPRHLPGRGGDLVSEHRPAHRRLGAAAKEPRHAGRPERHAAGDSRCRHRRAQLSAVGRRRPLRHAARSPAQPGRTAAQTAHARAGEPRAGWPRGRSQPAAARLRRGHGGHRRGAARARRGTGDPAFPGRRHAPAAGRDRAGAARTADRGRRRTGPAHRPHRGRDRRGAVHHPGGQPGCAAAGHAGRSLHHPQHRGGAVGAHGDGRARDRR